MISRTTPLTFTITGPTALDLQRNLPQAAIAVHTD